MRKKFLFLQGCTSGFFHLLASSLRKRGHQIARVNFNVGDVVFFRGGDPTWNYAQSVDLLDPLLQRWTHQHEITDMVMLGDTRPIHSVACKVAKRLNLTTHIFEEGYLRPYWLTLERDGINGNSRLPKNPEWYRRVAPTLPEPEFIQIKPNSLPLLAAWEIAYHLPSVFNPVFFSGYRTHRPVISGLEFMGWATRFAKMPFYRHRDQSIVERLLYSGRDFYLFPLQLDGDSQIVYHSSFESISKVITHVLTSYASNAHSDSILVIKNHPLDTGLINYERHINQLAQELGIQDRVLYLETGNLEELSHHAIGMVTINSTLGMLALSLKLPLISLGGAIYNMSGLTYQGELDLFWKANHQSDASLFECFKKAVMYTTQINGGFYSREGCQLAIKNTIEALEAPQSRLEKLLS